MTETHLPVLAVDLDGTLLRSDLLFETGWAAIAEDWRAGPEIFRELKKGRAQLKAFLAERTSLDVSQLPYNETVIAHIKSHRAAGGRTALVTASHQSLADQIATHLDIFDEVYGSDEVTNLKGETKARFLTETYGPKGFVYMGDSAADLGVWPEAAKAITVNAPAALRKEADALGVPVTHMDAAPPKLADYLRALRPHQWLKNALIFLPMLAAQALTFGNIALSLLAFLAFSLVASSVYLLNDLLDLSADRAHPRKRNRPLAAGRIPIAHGSFLAPGLLGAGIVIALLLGPSFFLVMCFYYILTLAYSVRLKQIPIVDICILAGLYTTRILAGGAATGIVLSVWLLAFSVFLFFSLAAVKRLAELIDSRDNNKKTIARRGYQVQDIEIVQSMAVASGYVSVLVMTLYINSQATLVAYSRPEALWGISVVLLYWISRTIFLTHRGYMHDDPVIFAIKDSVSRLCICLVFIFALVAALF